MSDSFNKDDLGTKVLELFELNISIAVFVCNLEELQKISFLFFQLIVSKNSTESLELNNHAFDVSTAKTLNKVFKCLFRLFKSMVLQLNKFYLLLVLNRQSRESLQEGLRIGESFLSLEISLIDFT